MVIGAILSRNGLFAPDGRPVHAYLIKHSEFAELEQSLRTRASGGRKTTDWAQREAAEFCMFVAEWWRRDFDGGAWKWEPILKQAGLPKVTRAQYLDLVERGLEWLGREIVRTQSNNRQFLGTLAAEGGFPLQLLRQSATPTNFVRTAFRALFRALGDDFTGHLDATQLARAQWATFPDSFQQAIDELAPIMAQFAIAMWNLAAKLEPGSSLSPLEQLNKQQPGWKGTLPITVEDQQLEEVLGELLKDAGQERSQKGEALKVFHRLFSDGTGDWHLEAIAGLPDHISDTSLGEQLGITPEHLRPTFQLVSEAENGRPTLLATVSRTGEKSYKIEGKPAPILGRDLLAAQTIRVGAVFGMTQLSTSFAPLSFALEDEPWVFFTSEHTHEKRLLTTGSVCSSRNELFVALLDSPDTPMAFDQGSEGQPIGKLHGLNRTLYRIQGRQFIKSHSGYRWRIEANAKQNEDNEVRLRGELWNFTSSSGRRIFGPYPEVVFNNLELSLRQLRWRTPQGREYPLATAPLGDGFLQYIDQDILLFQRRITRLPADLSIRVTPPSQDNPATILLEDHAHEINAKVINASVDSDSSYSAGIHRLLVRPFNKQEPPARLTLRLEWPQKTSTRLSLPFPLSPTRFVHPEGKVFAPNGFWPLLALHGVAAEAFPFHAMSKAPRIHGQFSSTKPEVNSAPNAQELVDAATFDISLPAINDNHHRDGSSSRYRLMLSQIREHIERAFAASGDLDAKIKLKLYWDGTSSNYHARIDITHYAAEFEEVMTNEFEARWLTGLPQVIRENYRVIAFPFHSPDQVFELIRTTEDRWLLPPAFPRDRAACIVGIDAGGLCVRPRTLPAQHLSDTSRKNLSAWEQTCELPSRHERLAACRKLCAELSQNSEHENWKHVRATLSRTQDMPATSFDLLEALSETSDAAAMALLREPKTGIHQVWDALEQFAFMWHAVPIKAWENAIQLRRQEHKLACQKLPPEMREHALASLNFQTLVNEFRRRLGSEFPALIWLDYKLQLGLGTDIKSIDMARAMPKVIQEFLEEEFAELRKRQNPDHVHWPEWRWDFRQITQDLPLTLRFKPRTESSWQVAIACAPLIAAEACARNITLQKPMLIRLRRAQAFDSQWFESAYCYALGLMLATQPDDSQSHEAGKNSTALSNI